MSKLKAKPKAPKGRPKKYLNPEKAFAEGEITDDGFVVYKGGKCNLKEAPSQNKYRRDLRERLIEDDILIQENDVLVFQTDHIFS